MNNRLYASYNELTGELEEKSGQYSDLLIDWEQNYNHMSAQEARIRQLEQNRKHMEEEHQRALVFAADRISAAERKLTELQHQQGTITQQQPPKRTRRPRRKTLQGKDDVQGKDNVQGKDDGGVDVYSKALDRACETARPRDCTAVETQQNKDDGRTNMQGQTFDRAFETVHVEAE
jgi:predicted nuclease with TOPRIM domain